MKKILAAMLLILIVILAAGAGYQWWSSGNGNKKQFQKSKEILEIRLWDMHQVPGMRMCQRIFRFCIWTLPGQN